MSTLAPEILVGDAVTMLRTLEAESAVACVTSPPYWRQRNYLPDDSPLSELEIGQEACPEEWVGALVDVFREVRRVLVADGCLWLNAGDKYAAGGYGGGGYALKRLAWRGTAGFRRFRKPPPGYKPKDLTLAPLDLARALRDDGWYLRSTVIWEKHSAVEPPRLDRPSVSHEYLFLLTKAEDSRVRDPGESWWQSSVWRLVSDRDGTHVAQMPLELARRCIVTCTQPGDLVLEPFCGSGTTLLAARGLGRPSLGIELDPVVVEEIARPRVRGERLKATRQAVGLGPLFPEAAS